MLIFIAVFAVLIIGLPGFYTLLIHRRDLREKAEAKKEASA
jgi:hypothetical protein